MNNLIYQFVQKKMNFPLVVKACLNCLNINLLQKIAKSDYAFLYVSTYLHIKLPYYDQGLFI